MKRLLALLLAALMLLTLYACAGTQGKTPAEQPDAPAEPDAPATPDTPETPDAPSAALPGGTLPDVYQLGWNTPCASAQGTGAKAETAPPAVLTCATGIWNSTAEPVTEDGCTVYLPTVELTGFRSPLLQKTVEDGLAALIADVRARRPATDDLSARIAAHGAEAADATYSINFTLGAVGSLLSVRAWGALSISYGGADGAWYGGEYQTVYADTLWYDLRDGHRMTLSDLFPADCDYMALLNRAVRDKLAADDYELTRAFAGLPENYPYVACDGYNITVELTDRCPYLSPSDLTYMTEFGATLYFDLSAFWRYMPILWGDSGAYFEENVLQYNAPARFALRMSSAPITLPSSDGTPVTVDLPRVAGGVPDEVMAPINASLDELSARAETLIRTWYDESVAAEGQSWAWLDPSYRVVGPLLCVGMNINVGNATTRWTELCAVYDLRTGARMTAAQFVSADGLDAAVQSLVQTCRLTEEEARAALTTDLFFVGNDLSLWGPLDSRDGREALSWSLLPAYVDQHVFETEE